MTASIHIGPIAPEALVLDLTPEVAADIDLSTVSAAVLHVQTPQNGYAEEIWACGITNQSATTLRLTHTFLAADADKEGIYTVVAILTCTAGTVKSDPREFRVKGKYEI